MESEALLLRAGMRAGLIDPDKGTAALVVYAQIKKLGAALSFGDFLVERKLIGRMALDGLEGSMRSGVGAVPKIVSRVGDFELLELLGEGTGGSVFKAKQVSLDRYVAVKILAPKLAADPEALKHFLDEAKICARLNHPHVVNVIRVAVSQGLYYLAMELIEGGSLRDLIRKTPHGLPEPKALELAKQVAAALSAAHNAGLVHRDVKPENVLMTTDGQAKLADLGIAVASDLSKVLQSERESEFWGTPAYVAPEVIEGSVSGDPRSDLYSLGAMLYEMLCGKPPFVGGTPQEVLRQQISSDPLDIRKLRPALSPQTSALLKRLLDRNPEQRFPGAASLVESIEVIEALTRQGIAHQNPEQAAPVSPTPSNPMRRARLIRRRVKVPGQYRRRSRRRT